MPDLEVIDLDVIDYAHRMFECARNGDHEQLIANVENGLPINLTNGSGDTLLILAAYYANADTVEALLSVGADHGRVNDRGQTALACAVFRQCDAAITLLLDVGADPTAGAQSAIAVASFFDLDLQRTQLLGASS